ncbi:hypothetical protein OQA88_6169 [Cercophora sp. LCS_1]
MSDEDADSVLSTPPESLFDPDSPVKTKTNVQDSAGSGPSLMEQLLMMEAAQETTPTGRPKRAKKPHWKLEPEATITTKGADEQNTEPQKSNEPGKRHSVSGAKKSAQDKKWEAPSVFTDEKSPLTQADLRSILLLPGAWDILTKEEQQEILASFPDESHILDAGTENARPDPQSLCNDDNFRNDCARYCENLGLGRHDEDWLAGAWTAHEQHSRGDFDEYLIQKIETNWDVEIPEAHTPKHFRESIDSSTSKPRRESVDTTISEQITAQSYSSPGGAGSEHATTSATMSAANLRRLRELTLDSNTPSSSEAGPPTARSPSALKRKRIDDTEGGQRKASTGKLGRQSSTLSIDSTLAMADPPVSTGSETKERSAASMPSVPETTNADESSPSPVVGTGTSLDRSANGVHITPMEMEDEKEALS